MPFFWIVFVLSFHNQGIYVISYHFMIWKRYVFDMLPPCYLIYSTKTAGDRPYAKSNRNGPTFTKHEWSSSDVGTFPLFGSGMVWRYPGLPLWVEGLDGLSRFDTYTVSHEEICGFATSRAVGVSVCCYFFFWGVRFLSYTQITWHHNMQCHHIKTALHVVVFSEFPSCSSSSLEPLSTYPFAT